MSTLYEKYDGKKVDCGGLGIGTLRVVKDKVYLEMQASGEIESVEKKQDFLDRLKSHLDPQKADFFCPLAPEGFSEPCSSSAH